MVTDVGRLFIFNADSPTGSGSKPREQEMFLKIFFGHTESGGHDCSRKLCIVLY